MRPLKYINAVVFTVVMGTWDDSAETYHEYTNEFPQYAELNEELAAFVAPSDDVIFDLGCGTGETTAALLDQDSDSEVIGIDPSRAMLDIYEERFGCTTIQSTACEAPYEEERPTKAVAGASWWYFDHPALLQNARPTDALYISINQTFLDFTDNEGHRAAFIHALNQLLREHGYEPRSVDQQSMAEFKLLVQDHGWDIVNTETVELTPADPNDSEAFFSIPAVSPAPDAVSEPEYHELLSQAADRVDGVSGTNKWVLIELTT